MQQSLAQELLDIKKQIDGGVVVLDQDKKSYKLFPLEKGYEIYGFTLDISKSRIAFYKHTTQKRVKTSIVLARLDIGGHHTNPPLEESAEHLRTYPKETVELMHRYASHRYRKTPHLHIYLEHYHDKWAFPPEVFSIEKYANIGEALLSFCEVFNIEKPKIETGLF